MGTKKHKKQNTLFLPISDSNVTRAMVPSFDEQKALRSSQTTQSFSVAPPLMALIESRHLMILGDCSGQIKGGGMVARQGGSEQLDESMLHQGHARAG
jgi:hypothetical protein